MSTTLYLRTTTNNGIGSFKDMISTIGAGNTTYFVSSVSGPAEVQWTSDGGQPVVEWISGRAPAGGFTLSGSVTFNMDCYENNPNTNCGARVRLFKRSWDGTETELGGSPFDAGVEFGTGSPALNTWSATPSSTAFGEDDRLIARLYIVDAGGTMSAGFCGLGVDGSTSGTNDSNIVLTETVAFKAVGDPDGSHGGGGGSKLLLQLQQH